MESKFTHKTLEHTTIKWLTTVLLAGAFIWSYWPTLTELWEFWRHNPDYSVGRLVPLVAIYLIWTDRNALRTLPMRVCWWGLAVILSAQAIRFFGLFFYYGSLERYSMVLTVAGIVLLIFGYSITRRLVYVLVFLLLTVPLPDRVHNSVSLPLQSFAASSAVVGLEMLGYVVDRQGNVLTLGEDTSVAVAEACSGLRMLTAFVMVAATLAFLVRRPRWQKTILVISSIPVAIIANTLRLIVTVVLYEKAGSEVAERFFHDFAGLSMMPFAIMILVGELWLLKRIAQAPPKNSGGISH